MLADTTHYISQGNTPKQVEMSASGLKKCLKVSVSRVGLMCDFSWCRERKVQRRVWSGLLKLKPVGINKKKMMCRRGMRDFPISGIGRTSHGRTGREER